MARKLKLEKEAMLVFDRGYTDYDWFGQLTEQGVHFVTRLKDKASYLVIKRLKAKGPALADEVIVLEEQAASDHAPFLRRVR